MLTDFLAMPAEERYHELIDGLVVKKPANSFEHGDALAVLSHYLSPFRARGTTSVHAGSWWVSSGVEIWFGSNICRPDLVAWVATRLPGRPSGTPIEQTPDFVCEVLATSNRRVDLVSKKLIYHRHQVGHYWIVDPDLETLSVHRWHEDGYIEVLVAEREQKVRAEPFGAVELPVGVLFGDDEDFTD